MKAKLTKRLLKLGGSKVEYVKDDHTDLVLRYGEKFTEVLEDFKMQPNRCHMNCCLEWLVNRDGLIITTGYALSSETWVSHSWLTSGNLIVETCGGSREIYFGVRLTVQHSIEFCRQIEPMLLSDYETAKKDYMFEWDFRQQQRDLFLGLKKKK